jgi:hypothetical protein
MHYSVNGKEFKSYFQAIAEAQSQNTEVIEIATGQVKWKPLPPVSKKRIKRYLENKNAHEAYVASLKK